MKKCPSCMRDYYDDSLSYCLDDGSLLLEGPGSGDEPATARMSVAGAAVAARGLRSEQSDVPERSIAVLPFAHLSGDPDDEYFCDGLAEELLNALARVEDLRVAARTSSFSYKGKDVNVSAIGVALGVNTVLEGSVRKSGNRLRITVQLVNTTDGYQLWSERYDREMSDIFEVQDEITLAVVNALKVKLFGAERSAVLKKGTANAEAYQLYLRGRAVWNRRTQADFERAIEYFDSAIALDPKYALAYAGLADSYTLLAYYEAFSPGEMEPKARAAVERAIELDPSLAECHSSMAMYRRFFEFEMEASESELRKAIAINPNSSLAHYWLSAMLATQGRIEESVDEGRKALDLDPLSAIVNASLARSLCCAGKFDEAIELSNKNFEIVPGFFFSHWVLGWAHGQKGQKEESIEHFRAAAAQGGFLMYGHFGKALIEGGCRDEARALFAELTEESKHRFVSPVPAAIIHASLGNVSEGLRLLDKAWDMRIISLMWLKADPVFDAFRSEPRFWEIVHRVGLPK